MSVLYNVVQKGKKTKQKKQECKRFEINVVSIKKSLTEYPH